MKVPMKIKNADKIPDTFLNFPDTIRLFVIRFGSV